MAATFATTCSSLPIPSPSFQFVPVAPATLTSTPLFDEAFAPSSTRKARFLETGGGRSTTEWLARGSKVGEGSHLPLPSRDTLAERRLRTAKKSRPATVRKRSHSMGLPKIEWSVLQEGAREGGTKVTFDTRHGKQDAKEGLSIGIGYPPRRYGYRHDGSSDDTESHLSGLSSSSSRSDSSTSEPSSGTSTSFATTTFSTFAASPISPPGGWNPVHSRRLSDPTPSQLRGWPQSRSEGSSPLLPSASSDQGLGVLDEPSPPSTSRPVRTSDDDGPDSDLSGSGSMSDSDSQSRRSSSPTTEEYNSANNSTTSVPAIQVDSSRPSKTRLPSPLILPKTSTPVLCETPNPTGWSEDGSGSSEIHHGLRMDGPTEFPFPASPVTHTFISGTLGPSRVPAPPDECPASPSPMSSSAPKRSRRLDATPSKPVPPKPVHRTSTSVSVNQARTMTCPAPRTPPYSSETTSLSRQYLSSADLAWNDVGMGRLGGMGSGDYGVAHLISLGGRSASSFTSKPPVCDLMSLEESPVAVRIPLQSAALNPSPVLAEGVKRVGNEDLMVGSGGHFGPATRERMASIIKELIGGVPLSETDEVVHIVEYGALNSRSSSIVAPIISDLAARYVVERKVHPGVVLTDEDTPSFHITHADKLQSDFRTISNQLETASDSYLNPQWQASHSPPLVNKVFSSFTSRPFGAKVLPRGTVSVGFSAMSLHWLSTDRKYRMSPAALAHGELMAFLSARATEFKPGGLLTMSFICRSEPPSVNRGTPRDPPRSYTTARSHDTPKGAPAKNLDSPSSTKPMARERSHSSPASSTPTAGRSRDIWTVLSGILAKAIQRLVSTQLLKPAVARQLLALPIHPRTARQTSAVLRAMQHAWTVESEDVLVLAHPAWRGLKHNTVSPASYTEHTIQLLKIFWEFEMRSILREASLSRAACEWILECLFDIAREKIDEEGPQPLILEVQVVALRRKDPLTLP